MIPVWEGIRTTLNPAGYHGLVLSPPFFEGWYVKLIDSAEHHRLAVIPGVFLNAPGDASGEAGHAFVQVLDGRTGQSFYVRYPLESFHAARHGFDLRVGPNRFTVQGVTLDLDAPGLRLRGDIRFETPAPRPWPVQLLSPGIMGPFAWIPRMECYHGVISLDHGLAGSLEVNGQTQVFDGGRGYIEKDWGKNFPAAWVWFQTNHFDRLGVCLTASVAVIPWLGHAFGGFIIGLLLDGQLHRFATYTGARITRFAVLPDRVSITVQSGPRWRGGRETLELEALRAQGGLLQAPTPTGMDRRIAETLDAAVQVRLLRGGQVVYQGDGRNAGLEAVGDLGRLRKMVG